LGKHHHHNTDFNSQNFDKKRLKIVFVVNILVATGEVIAGFVFSNSYSLAGDGVHMLTHIPAVFFVLYLYGRKSSENISSLITGSLILFAGCYIAFSAVWRLSRPEIVQEKIMIAVAIVGLIANVFQILMLKPTNRNKRNMRDLFWHLMGDTFYSVCIVCGGVTILYTQKYQIDPLLSFLILPFLFSWGYRSVRDAVKDLKK